MGKLTFAGAALLLGLAMPIIADDIEQPSARQCDAVANDVVWYISNRLMDLEDIVSLSLGAGAASSAEVKVTSFADFGWFAGKSYTWTDNGYNRCYGTGSLSGRSFWVGPFVDSDLEYRHLDNWYNRVLENELKQLASYDRRFSYLVPGGTDYIAYSHGWALVNPGADIYQDNNVDLWGVGVQAGFLINAKVMIHPVQIADFITSWFGWDLANDDNQ